MTLVLEEFGLAPGPTASRMPAPEPVPDPEVAEAERAKSYELGYQAGWDDATRAEAEAQDRIGADFARSLQELTFTFHEARTHLLGAMEPLLNELVSTFLPALVAETLGARILEELQPLVAAAADAPIELVVSPASRPALEPQLQASGIAGIQLREEPSLADGQAYLRVGQAERQIDLSSALDRITEAIRSLYALNERTLQHG